MEATIVGLNRDYIGFRGFKGFGLEGLCFSCASSPEFNILQQLDRGVDLDLTLGGGDEEAFRRLNCGLFLESWAG